MIDIKSKLILKILAQEGENGGYKIVEASDIILALPKHYRMDVEGVKHILTHLERQDMISIKYDDDNLYCLAVLPYGFEVLETDRPSSPSTKKDNKIWLILLSFLLGSLFGALIYFLFSKFL